jgi:hypothetical protein
MKYYGVVQRETKSRILSLFLSLVFFFVPAAVTVFLFLSILAQNLIEVTKVAKNQIFWLEFYEKFSLQNTHIEDMYKKRTRTRAKTRTRTKTRTENKAKGKGKV